MPTALEPPTRMAFPASSRSAAGPRHWPARPVHGLGLVPGGRENLPSHLGRCRAATGNDHRVVQGRVLERPGLRQGPRPLLVVRSSRVQPAPELCLVDRETHQGEPERVRAARGRTGMRSGSSTPETTRVSAPLRSYSRATAASTRAANRSACGSSSGVGTTMPSWSMSTYAVATPSSASSFKAAHAVVDFPAPGGPYSHRIRIPEQSAPSGPLATWSGYPASGSRLIGQHMQRGPPRPEPSSEPAIRTTSMPASSRRELVSLLRS